MTQNEDNEVDGHRYGPAAAVPTKDRLQNARATKALRRRRNACLLKPAVGGKVLFNSESSTLAPDSSAWRLRFRSTRKGPYIS